MNVYKFTENEVRWANNMITANFVRKFNLQPITAEQWLYDYENGHADRQLTVTDDAEPTTLAEILVQVIVNSNAYENAKLAIEYGMFDNQNEAECCARRLYYTLQDVISKVTPKTDPSGEEK